MIGLYFGGQWFQTQFGNFYGNIELDAALEESHLWSAEVTSNPVEDGAPITDHVIEKSDELKIRGFVADHPITTISSISNSANPSQATFDLLNRLIKAREVMAVYTKQKTYVNMILQSVDIPRVATVGEAIEFTAEFINIRKVATQTVDLPKGIGTKPSAGAIARKASASKDGGKKQPKVIKKPSSVLFRALN